MILRTSMTLAASLFAFAGCAVAPPEVEVHDPPATSASLETFAGTWQSITPLSEFVRLTVVSKSSEKGVLGTRLLFSGTYWEGSGRIDGDSLIADVGMAGAMPPTGVLTGHVRNGGKLELRLRTGPGAPLDLTFVREH